MFLRTSPRRLTALTLGTLALVALVVVAIGYMLPQNHRVSRERTFPANAETLFAQITDVAAYPEWRTGVTRVEILAPVNGLVSFRESGSDDDIAFVMETVEPGRRVVSRITDKSLPFGGSWTYELTPAGGGTAWKSDKRPGQVSSGSGRATTASARVGDAGAAGAVGATDASGANQSRVNRYALR